MTIEANVQGQRVRLVGSQIALGVLLDTWEYLEQPLGSWKRVGFVATFPVGRDWGPGSMPDAPTLTAYDDHPGQDPVKRFQEAFRQEKERARDRLGGSLHFQQAHPPGEG